MAADQLIAKHASHSGNSALSKTSLRATSSSHTSSRNPIGCQFKTSRYHRGTRNGSRKPAKVHVVKSSRTIAQPRYLNAVIIKSSITELAADEMWNNIRVSHTSCSIYYFI